MLGYTVHPVPAPLSIILLKSKNVKEGESNQNLILFKRGKAISGAPIINGIKQLPNPSFIIGITIKNYNKCMSSCNGVINLVISN